MMMVRGLMGMVGMTMMETVVVTEMMMIVTVVAVTVAVTVPVTVAVRLPLGPMARAVLLQYPTCSARRGGAGYAQPHPSQVAAGLGPGAQNHESHSRTAFRVRSSPRLARGTSPVVL